MTSANTHTKRPGPVRPRASLALFGLLTLCACQTGRAAPAATPSPSPLDEPGAWIAFQSDRDGNGEIYALNAAGRLAGGSSSAPLNLTQNAANDSFPAWSPDGSQIAFVSDRAGAMEVYVISVADALLGPAGPGPTRLTHNAADDWALAWSPDGQWIAFASNRPPAQEDIYLTRLDGTGQVRLTDSPSVDSGPAWSPDGTRLAFYSDRDGNGEIYVIEVSGALAGQGVAAAANLTHNPAEDVFPAWSPDGRRIAFASNRDGNFDLYLMNPDGTDVTRLTEHEAIDTYPAWSPDGTRLLFSSGRGEDTEVFVINADGSGLLNVSEHPAEEYNPVWRP